MIEPIAPAVPSPCTCPACKPVIHHDVTRTDIEMRATLRGRDQTLVYMVLGDRRDSWSIESRERDYPGAVAQYIRAKTLASLTTYGSGVYNPYNP